MLELVPRDVGGVRFDGDLCVRRKAEIVEKVLEERRQVMLAEHARGATANVERIKNTALIFIGQHLLQEGFLPIRNKGKGCNGIKITVRALCATKRDMDIEAGSFVVIHSQSLAPPQKHSVES